MNKKVLRLHPNDNCVVALMDIYRGDCIEFEEDKLVAVADIALGHKLAIDDIPCGGKIYKYGAIIGSATVAIAKGEHIHTQNLASDYIASFHH